MAGPFAPVSPPLVVPPVINLVTSARKPADETDGRWVNGFQFQPAINADPALVDPCDSGNVVAGDDTGASLVETVPWLAEIDEECSAMGYRGHDYIGRAVAGLAASTPVAVEWEFWTGELATAAGWPNLFLTNGDATDVTPTPGTAVSLAEAIGLLEAALASCGAGGRGMLHLPAVLTPSPELARRVTTAQGDLLLTQRDTIIVVGSGYPGTDPDGADPDDGTTWAYATGLVDVRVGDIEVFGAAQGQSMWLGVNETGEPLEAADGFDVTKFAPAALDRSDNTVKVRARRPVAAAWDGKCHFAVLVNYPSGAE